MAAQAIRYQSGGTPDVGVVTNGLTYVTISLPEIPKTETGASAPGRSIHLTELEVEELISALASKVVNLHRGVHDNSEGAI